MAAVGVAHRLGLPPAEHDVELREAEHEVVTLIDEDDVGVIAQVFGERGGELEAAKARTEDEDPHRAMLRPALRPTRVPCAPS